MYRAVNWSVFMQGVNNAELVTKMSVSDKMKFFEKAMEEQHQPSPKSGKPYEVAITHGSMCPCNRMYEERMKREGNMVEARNVLLMSKFQTVFTNFKFPV
jgi:hypothetical protein